MGINRVQRIRSDSDSNLSSMIFFNSVFSFLSLISYEINHIISLLYLKL